jgi:hypothetical protein
MRVLSGCAAVKRPARAADRRSDLPDAIDKHIVRKRDDLLAFNVNIAVQVPDQVSDTRRFGYVARVDNEHVLVGGGDDIGGLGIMMQQLPGMEDRPGWQLECEDDAVGRFDEPSHATAIVCVHREFDDGKSRRRLSV